MSLFITLKDTLIKAGSTKLSIAFLFIIAIIFNLNQSIDTSSKHHVDKAFNRAIIAFGIAKSLNGVISVAQGTEVAIQPAGIGINLTPGQILDPVNDLIERFSWIMLASTTSLGIQKVFLTMSTWPEFTYFFAFILVFSLAILFTQSTNYFYLKAFIIRAALLLIVIRFAVPITGLANEFVYQVFLEKEYITSTAQLETTADHIGELNKEEQYNQPDIQKKSVWESAKSFYNSTSEMFDINKRVEKYKKAAADTTYHVINLIIVFLFQSVLIPLAFIFIVYSVFKYIAKVDMQVLK